jgi:hypothetical protein
MSELRFNPRAMMERAIEAMWQSVDESRNDGKASPKVGAVLTLVCTISGRHSRQFQHSRPARNLLIGQPAPMTHLLPTCKSPDSYRQPLTSNDE